MKKSKWYNTFLYNDNKHNSVINTNITTILFTTLMNLSYFSYPEICSSHFYWEKEMFFGKDGE